MSKGEIGNGLSFDPFPTTGVHERMQYPCAAIESVDGQSQFLQLIAVCLNERVLIFQIRARDMKPPVQRQDCFGNVDRSIVAGGGDIFLCHGLSICLELGIPAAEAKGGGKRMKSVKFIVDCSRT